MKKFGQGLFVGVLITLLLVSGVTLAANPIKLIVNGQEVKTDVAPQLIDGRVMVPARYVAEPLGATVEWVDGSVVIRSKDYKGPVGDQTDLISARDLAEKYGVSLIIQDPGPGAPVRLSLGDKVIETKDYKIVDGSMYFKKDLINQLNTDKATAVLKEPESPKTYKFGDVIEFTDTKIRVNGISYADKHGTLVAGSDMKFALVDMDVWISEPPKDAVKWSGNRFLSTWHTKDSKELFGGFTTGNSMGVDENKWNNITVAIEILNSDEIVAVTIADPLTPRTFIRVSNQ